MSGDEVCAKVTAVICQECPPGLGGWDRAWEIVEEASKTFLSWLARMAAGEPCEEQAKKAGNEVVKAWRRAKKEWEGAGKP